MDLEGIMDDMEYGPARESDGEARNWLARHEGGFGHFINGDFVTTEGSESFASRNPANGETLAQLEQASGDTVNAAVIAANVAQENWARRSGHDRARVLYALARQVQKHHRLFAVLETLDNGKPIRESRDIDIPLVIRHFYHHAGWAQLANSELSDYEPVGVIGQVIPWNFPLLMLAWKIAPALAAGNTVVLKPAEYTSLTALLFAEICQDAGVPPGVINIITGDGRVGALLTEHPKIQKVAFTGSTEVGRHIREAIAGSGKKLTLELGGKSPFIVFDDADMDAAVEGLVDAIWFNQGEVCCAGSRLLVQESIAATLLEKVRRRMDNLRVGNPLDKAIDIGAVADPVQLQQIRERVDQGVEEGAEIYQPDCMVDPHEQGCFYPPTLMVNVESSFKVAQEEIFGPVLVSMTFRTPAEAVDLANNTRYGLAASIWSENINLALDLAPKLKAGVVWINCSNQFDAACGFGGVRESGFGREGGREGMLEYMKPRYERKLGPYDPESAVPASARATSEATDIDRTPKFYIGGKQARPDSGYSRDVLSYRGKLLGQVGEGNRKDIRNAVEAAAKAEAWSKTNSHSRAQILYYIAENLSARRSEFVNRLIQQTGQARRAGNREVDAAISRLFSYAAWADKYDGATHTIPMRSIAMSVHEPHGLMGLVCPNEFPLLGFVSLVAPAIAMGNRVVVVPSETHPLSATDLYQVFDTSDVPAGVINIVCGVHEDLGLVLADHYNVDALWYRGSPAECKTIEKASAANLKSTWVNCGQRYDLLDTEQGEGRDYLRQATQVKTIWAPYGE
jgi:aldehyde dehydrogenase (NAD+)